MRGLKEGAEDICSVFADKGLEWQQTAELDVLLSGELSAGEDAKRPGLPWARRSADAFGAKTRAHRALLREIGVDPGANIRDERSAPLAEERWRCGPPPYAPSATFANHTATPRAPLDGVSATP